MNQRRILEQLATAGWALIEEVEFAELVDLCDGLGKTRTVKRLVARPETEACGPSLTANFGLGRFPPHTDGANEALAPRYVALWSSGESGAATLLYDGEDSSLDLPVFSRAWLTGAGRQRFYVIPRRVNNGHVHWRLNLDCMRPVISDDVLGEELAHLERLPSTRVEWKPKRALVFNNARVLHGREGITTQDRKRELMRVSVV